MRKKLILKGRGASPGIVRGKVRVISPDDPYAPFGEGEILVTKITNPSMIFIMSKAAAIVSDIGGITSHPAIISRELGIPCVAATYKATRILKDGDTVEVDGKGGTVYLLGE